LQAVAQVPRIKAEFSEALNRRITNRNVPQWRKLAPGYLERIRMLLAVKSDAAYLRYYTQRKASALDYY
jgi:hypothetical protein